MYLFVKPRIFGWVPRVAILGAVLAAFFGSFWIPSTVSGQEQVPRGITVALVLDDSRSMAETDPNRLRGLGGRLLVERLFPDDRIATVFFSTDATVVQPVEKNTVT